MSDKDELISSRELIETLNELKHGIQAVRTSVVELEETTKQQHEENKRDHRSFADQLAQAVAQVARNTTLIEVQGKAIGDNTTAIKNIDEKIEKVDEKHTARLLGFLLTVVAAFLVQWAVNLGIFEPLIRQPVMVTPEIAPNVHYLDPTTPFPTIQPTATYSDGPLSSLSDIPPIVTPTPLPQLPPIDQPDSACYKRMIYRCVD